MVLQQHIIVQVVPMVLCTIDISYWGSRALATVAMEANPGNFWGLFGSVLLVLRQGAVGALWRLDRERGNSGCLMPADGGVWLQEVAERAGGALLTDRRRASMHTSMQAVAAPYRSRRCPLA